MASVSREYFKLAPLSIGIIHASILLRTVWVNSRIVFVTLSHTLGIFSDQKRDTHKLLLFMHAWTNLAVECKLLTMANAFNIILDSRCDLLSRICFIWHFMSSVNSAAYHIVHKRSNIIDLNMRYRNDLKLSSFNSVFMSLNGIANMH